RSSATRTTPSRWRRRRCSRPRNSWRRSAASSSNRNRSATCSSPSSARSPATRAHPDRGEPIYQRNEQGCALDSILCRIFCAEPVSTSAGNAPDMGRTVRIGCGAGFAGDRLEPALVLAEHGAIDYLGLECLGERTVALAQGRRLGDPQGGYDPMLERRLEGLLGPIKRNRIRVLTNMGAANPAAAAARVAALAERKGVALKVAAVLGDDVLERLDVNDPCLETGAPLKSFGDIVSAN